MQIRIRNNVYNVNMLLHSTKIQNILIIWSLYYELVYV
jgi:hypothetical protein